MWTISKRPSDLITEGNQVDQAQYTLKSMLIHTHHLLLLVHMNNSQENFLYDFLCDRSDADWPERLSVFLLLEMGPTYAFLP